MKALSNVFILIAILLSNVMCIRVAYTYCDISWGIKYAGYSAPVSTSFLLIIPYIILIVLCIIISRVIKRKGKNK